MEILFRVGSFEYVKKDLLNEKDWIDTFQLFRVTSVSHEPIKACIHTKDLVPLLDKEGIGALLLDSTNDPNERGTIHELLSMAKDTDNYSSNLKFIINEEPERMNIQNIIGALHNHDQFNTPT